MVHHYQVAQPNLQATVETQVRATVTALQPKPAEKPIPVDQSIHSDPKRLVRAYVEALQAGDFDGAISFLNPATRHRFQTEPKIRNAFGLFLTDFNKFCGNLPIRDVVIDYEMQQPVPFIKIEALLARPCKIPDAGTYFMYYGMHHDNPSLIPLKIPAPTERSSIPIELVGAEGKWYPHFQLLP